MQCNRMLKCKLTPKQIPQNYRRKSVSRSNICSQTTKLLLISSSSQPQPRQQLMQPLPQWLEVHGTKSHKFSFCIRDRLSLSSYTARFSDLVLLIDRLCGLVFRVSGYRSRRPGSIPDATGFSEKQWVSNSAS
jgi:hypothetical protein